ncbi:hypothetical protein BOTBODRAFT_118835 [Botryobasidium botryosum FD-172 SS1]|uniref:Nop14-like protein n=1 Tax=Botryobasidium botryosum (strain FD-172 SS1) TaxID=930990 RepID=A0A067LYA2_BOTB1|nr:hypothetical protein BOTBODRAFT_118835 [Botryobasidium botryosum FD-172 SS1]
MAKGGSQLTQLKSALSQAGLSRKSKPGQDKKKKQLAARDALDKDKKAAKLAEIQRKLNPFDVKVTKLKHDVGGRKLKGVTGRPGLSKQTGIEQRKKTLLVEYDQKLRAGGVIDRRFGENDPTMAPEERMLERFTKERQRQHRGSAFNLEDEDELTHYGQSLSAMDDFDETGLGGLDDEEEEETKGQIDSETVMRDHFGGFEDGEKEPEDPERKKSKAEVMAEVMAKSKEHKYLRQLQQQELDNARHQIDQEFDDIRDLLYAAPPDPLSASTDPSIPPTFVTSSNSIPVPAPANAIANDDDYDQFVRELAFEKRAKPTDRLKTEEEIAKEEKDKLEKAERSRLRRMRGEEDESEEEGHGRKKRRKAQADDLEDDFVQSDEEPVLGRGLGDESDAESEADSAGEGEDEEEGESEESDEEDEDESDDEDGGSDGFGDVDGESGAESIGESTKPPTSAPSRSNKGKGKSKELPFTFECPTSHDHFLEIIEGVDDDDVPTVVQRMRVIYHPSLAEGNKEKLQTLCFVLIDHLIYAASPPAPSFSLISALVPHIFALTQSYPIPSAQAFVSKLVLMQKNLTRGLTHGSLRPEAKTFPGTSEISLLRMIGLVWSTSDLSHPVVAPAMLLMGQYLAQARIRSVTDMASGLFVCTLFLQYQELSKRLVPEAINFLTNAYLHLAPHPFTPATVPGSFPSPDLNSEHCRSLKINTKAASTLEPGVPDLGRILSGGESTEQDKVDLLMTAFSLLGKYATIYTSLDGFIETFTPVIEVLDKLKVKKLSEAVQKRHLDLRGALTRMLKFAQQSRRPLLLQAHKPIPIATYIPKFDESYSYRKSSDPNHERNADSKLRAQYRQERKGAMRELRKDNRFLAAEQTKRQVEKDRAYKARMAKVEGALGAERHEEKQMEKEKMREKRRAGKK